jgi:hypothetical protein
MAVPRIEMDESFSRTGFLYGIAVVLATGKAGRPSPPAPIEGPNEIMTPNA